MSLILDALNKADQERSEHQDVPNLRALHGSPYRQTQPGFLQRWRVEAVFVGLLLLAYLSYRLFVGAAETQPRQLPQPAKVETPVLSQSSPSKAVPVVVAPTKPVKVAPGVATVAAPPAAAMPDSGLPGAPGVESADVKAAQPPPDTQLAVKSLYAQQRGVEANPESAPPVIPAVTTPAQPVSAAASIPKPQSQQSTNAVPGLKARLEKLPLLSELSPQKQQAVPSIDFSLHVYSNEQGTGFVKLNGQRRRTGEQVAPGLRLENIVDEFIVLSYQGSKFRLLSLNSWINLQ